MNPFAIGIQDELPIVIGAAVFLMIANLRLLRSGLKIEIGEYDWDGLGKQQPKTKDISDRNPINSILYDLLILEGHGAHKKLREMRKSAWLKAGIIPFALLGTFGKLPGRANSTGLRVMVRSCEAPMVWSTMMNMSVAGGALLWNLSCGKFSLVVV